MKLLRWIQFYIWCYRFHVCPKHKLIREIGEPHDSYEEYWGFSNRVCLLCREELQRKYETAYLKGKEKYQ